MVVVAVRVVRGPQTRLLLVMMPRLQTMRMQVGLGG